MSIVLFDTSIASLNKGDEIIMESVRDIARKHFAEEYIITLPTHEKITKIGRELIEDSSLALVGGTNLLTGNVLKYRQWKFGVRDLPVLSSKVVLLGVGWWQYQESISNLTSILYKKILSGKFIHSVRDTYTKNKLNSIGINNVCVTGCPTMWFLNEDHCDQIPEKKSASVVFTLTNYNKFKKYDSLLVELLLENYDRVYFWPQSQEDALYINSLDFNDDIDILSPSLLKYDNLLSDSSLSLDYVGTRLHAGIRALQNFRRTIIIGIDNRAREKARDFNLKVVHRKNLDDLYRVINERFKTRIDLPNENIEKWKRQF